MSQTEEALDKAVVDSAEHAFGFLERLVAQPSTLGQEQGAQQTLADELQALGFSTEWLPIPADLSEDPLAAIPPLPYDGTRRVLVARRSGADPAQGRSLLVNGHLDVVPAGPPERWTTDPFIPTREAGWLRGRGAGDMKGGWAMLALALRALDAVCPPPAGDLTVVGVIEEECGGNGTLASVRAGIEADAVLLPEPTDLQLLVRGTGVLWFDITVDGSQGHALDAHAGHSALDAAWIVVKALRALAADFTRTAEDGIHCNVNFGVFNAGEWPSSVPAAATLRVRVGFPASHTPEQAEARVRAAIDVAAAGNPWLSDNPPTITPSGFRAEPYALPDDAPLVSAVANAHADAHGERPRLVATNGTTDARYYLNQADTPALCYGPRMRRMHGIDEAVELASIVEGARTLARFTDRWLNTTDDGATA